MKSVLITGCSSGFGHMLVEAFLAQGWRVFASMRRAEERRSLFTNELEKYPEQLTLVTLDVTLEADRQAVVEMLGDQPLDCLVNNAGYALFGALENTSEDQLRQQYDVNLIAPALLTRDLLPALRRSKGSVINISSMMSFFAMPLSSAYCSSKAGLTMLSESLAHELAPHGVRVVVVEPGGFRTKFGANIQWSSVETPVYKRWTENFRALRDKIASGKGKSPKPVVERVVRMASASRPGLRQRVGNDAVLTGWFQKIVPEAIRVFMFRRAFKKMFNR